MHIVAVSHIGWFALFVSWNVVSRIQSPIHSYFPQGLVVPVIRNADRMNFADIEKEINTLAKKANNGTISIDEMAGGTFTISNGGVYGSLLSTPIINPPQVRKAKCFKTLRLSFGSDMIN